ncbi:MAG: type III secretion system chaperone [Abditibacteriaceae bacterium]
MKSKFLSSAAVMLGVVIGVASIRPALAAVAPATQQAAAPAPPEIPKKLSLLDVNKVLKSFDDYTAILQKVGYTTKVNTETSGKQVVVVNWKDKTGEYGVSLTQNKQDENEDLTFVAPLSSFADHPKVPAEVFFKLVEAQDATRGWYFVFNPKANRIFLCRTIPTTQITSRQLISELVNLEFAAQLTAGVWNPAMWITKPQPAPAAPAPPKTPGTAPTQ